MTVLTRQQLALKVGGRSLLKAILRANIRRVLVTKSIVHFKPIDLKTFQAVQDEYQNEPMPKVLSEDPKKLTEGDKLWLRNRYYQLVNAPPASLQRWLHDPRTVDCTLNGKPFEMLLVNTAIRDVRSLQSVGHRDGSGWSDRSYATAQKCIFVISHLFRMYGVQYFQWVWLQSFGHDWTRSLPSLPRRPLPPDTMLIAAERLRKLHGKRKPQEGWSS